MDGQQSMFMDENDMILCVGGDTMLYIPDVWRGGKVSAPSCFCGGEGV